ncbi:hypothetical protein EVAR_40274_1 [Eumeta japonica]|uniref:Uncharacterized protein n=1 Tax=Eumeta variegata TaxID=151549 RepID=A0A4C1WVW7_EUMVA|nr:hypothetical protein EVAR_40274_1 [Eumeta japonica]
MPSTRNCPMDATRSTSWHKKSRGALVRAEVSDCRERGKRTGLSTSEVSSSGGSERTFRGLRMKWCGGGGSYDTADCNNGFGSRADTVNLHYLVFSLNFSYRCPPYNPRICSELAACPKCLNIPKLGHTAIQSYAATT